jgi:prepilin-type N-terminal cleavage/methylation domain-containing protein
LIFNAGHPEGCKLPAKENKTSENKERYMKKGFTLIELMIVIAIIAIIAAIAIPNLLSGRMSANEASAIGALKLLTSAEAIFLQQSPDGNGMKDYWTYDVSCLHRMMRADDLTKVAFIPMDLARADCRMSVAAGGAAPFTDPQVETWVANVAGLIVWPKAGYWVTVMDQNGLDADPNPTGHVAYNTNNVGAAAIPACNSNQYAFMMVPDVYGTSGIRSFIVNEAGVVYAVDSGIYNESGNGFGTSPHADVPGAGTTGNKWCTNGAGEDLHWPSQNPPEVLVGTSSKPWEASD